MGHSLAYPVWRPSDRNTEGRRKWAHIYLGSECKPTPLKEQWLAATRPNGLKVIPRPGCSRRITPLACTHWLPPVGGGMVVANPYPQ